MTDIKQGLQAFFSNKVLLVTAYILLAIAIGALYPSSEYTPRWLRALLIGVYGALIVSMMYRTPHLLGARGKGKRLMWYGVLVATGLFFAMSSDDEPWWLSLYYPMLLSLIPLIMYEWFIGRRESPRATNGSKHTENVPNTDP